MLISTFFFLNAFSVENLAKRKKAIVIVVYLMHIKWLYFVRKHHIIKNRINILLSTSISYSAHRAINTNPEFYEILRNICYDSFPTTIHKTEKKNLYMKSDARYFVVKIKRHFDFIIGFLTNSYFILQISTKAKLF